MRRITIAVALALTGALLAACGTGGRTDEVARAAGITPPDVLAFVSVSLDPSIEQKRHLLSVAKAFPEADVKDEFDSARDDLLSDLAEEAGLDYVEDIEPAIADEIALAVFPPANPDDEPPAAVIAQIEDRAAAEELVGKGDERVAYKIVGDHLLATQAGPAAAAIFSRFSGDEKGGLAATEQFERLTGELHGDRLILGWVDLPRLAALTKEQAEDTVPLEGFDIEDTLGTAGPAAFDLHAENKALVFEAVAAATGEENGKRPELTEGLPADILGALTFFDLADSLSRVIEPLSDLAGTTGDGAGSVESELGLDPQRDILPWLGDEVVLAIGPVNESGLPEGALLVRPSDRAAAEAAELKIIGAVEGLTGPLTRFEVDGSRAHVVTAQEGSELPLAPAFGLLKDRFVIATSQEYFEQVAKGAGDSLGESEGYNSVIDKGTSGSTQAQLVLDIDAIREAIEQSFGLAEDEDYRRDTRPHVAPFEHFGLRSARVGDLNRFRAELTVD